MIPLRAVPTHDNEKRCSARGGGEGGGLAKGGVGEFGHAFSETGLGAETKVPGGGGRGSHDVPDVAEAEVAGSPPIPPPVCGSPLATLSHRSAPVSAPERPAETPAEPTAEPEPPAAAR